MQLESHSFSKPTSPTRGLPFSHDSWREKKEPLKGGQVKLHLNSPVGLSEELLKKELIN